MNEKRETELIEATDRLGITELLNRHQIYIDLADAERYAELYAPDGKYESPFASATSRSGITQVFCRLRDSGFTAKKRHFTGPLMIEIERDRATALSYWWVADYAGEHPYVFATGTYHDELQRVNGVWKITRRVQSVDSSKMTQGA